LVVSRQLLRCLSFVLLIGTATSCRLAARRAPAAADDGRSGAALAAITVRNDTGYPLVIAFRAASPPRGEIAVGHVAPGAEAAVAPVPADEPIILIARTPDRAELVLPPRTFGIGAHWRWHIPRDAPFRAPAGHAR
jgi:hypothetical protein